MSSAVCTMSHPGGNFSTGLGTLVDVSNSSTGKLTSLLCKAHRAAFPVRSAWEGGMQMSVHGVPRSGGSGHAKSQGCCVEVAAPGAGRERQGGISSRLRVFAVVGVDNSGTWDCSSRILADAWAAHCVSCSRALQEHHRCWLGSFHGGWWSLTTLLLQHGERCHKSISLVGYRQCVPCWEPPTCGICMHLLGAGCTRLAGQAQPAVAHQVTPAQAVVARWEARAGPAHGIPLGTRDLCLASLPLALTPRNSCPELIYFLMLQQC